MMKKILFVSALIASILLPLSFAFASNDAKDASLSQSETIQVSDAALIKTDTITEKKDSVIPTHPLEPLLKAIISVESKGNPKAYNPNGDCVGLLQITKICVRECNNILKRKKSSKRFTYADRWDGEKSIEMFYILQEAHNPTYDIDKGIRLWNKSTKYKAKVKRALAKQKK